MALVGLSGMSLAAPSMALAGFVRHHVLLLFLEIVPMSMRAWSVPLATLVVVLASCQSSGPVARVPSTEPRPVAPSSAAAIPEATGPGERIRLQGTGARSPVAPGSDLLPPATGPWTGDRANRVRLVAGEGKYPRIRREEVIAHGPAGERVVQVREMVADHALVTLAPGADTTALTAAGFTIRRLVPGSRVVLAAFPSDRLQDHPERLADLAAIPGVTLAEPDWIVHTLVTPSDPDYALLWGLDNSGQTGGTIDADIDAPEAWEVTTGTRAVVVGVLDTGIDLGHPDLVDNLWTNPGESGLDGSSNDRRTNGIDDDGNGYIDDWRGWDFVNEDNNPSDDQYHGTHCAGTIGATGNNGTGITGVCWKVSLVGLKFMAANGSGATSDALQAVLYANQMGFPITNNSWGGAGFSQTLLDAIVAGQASGHLFVAAAGNSTQDMDVLPSYPASYNAANIISVAASDHNDLRSSFSNYGVSATGVDLAAPGTGIVSTMPTVQTAAMVTAGHPAVQGSLNGTSMAAPHVAGVAALILSASATASWSEIKGAILTNADAVGIPGVPGGLRLNAFRAVTGSVPPIDPVPRVYVDTASRPFFASAAARADNAVILSASGTVSLVVVWNTPVIGFDATDISIAGPSGAHLLMTALTETKHQLRIGGLADGDTLQFTIPADCTGDYHGDDGGAARTSVAVTTTVYIDETAPATPVIAMPNGLATLARRPTLIGVGSTQAAGAITVGIAGSGPGGATSFGTAVQDSNGVWVYTPANDLVNGTWSFSASATDAAGNASGTSTPLTMYIWEAPTFTQDDVWQTTATPTLGGDNTSSALIAGLTVRLQIGSSASVPVTAATATTWTHVPSSLADGTYPVIVTQIKGTNTVTTGGTLKIDANAPGTPIVSGRSPSDATQPLPVDPLGRFNTSNARPNIVIAGLETVPVQLVPEIEQDDGSGWIAMAIPASAAFTAGSGTTAYRPDADAGLEDGVYRFRARQLDAAGNASPYSATIAVRVKRTVNPPTIDPLITQDTTPTVTGTAEPYASVVLRRNGVPLPTLVADGDGDWSYTFDVALPDGVYSMTARQTDLGGAVGTLSGAVSLRIDSQSPSAPIIQTPVTNTITATTTPTVTGVAEPGTVVRLVVDGLAQSATVAVGSAGTWTLTSTSLSAGGATHAISAIATDGAGNDSPEAVANVITISGSTFAIALTPLSATTPASGGATTARTALALVATLTTGGGATVADVAPTVFTVSDVVFSPAGSGRATVRKRAAASGHIWDLAITPLATSGTMSVSIPASSMTSTLHGVNTDSTPSPYVFTLDRVKPTAQILANDAQVNATHFRAKEIGGSGTAATIFSATAAFSEKVSGLSIADFSGVGATVSAIGASPDGGMTYPITIARVGTATLLSLSIKAAAVDDTATPANGNLTSAVFTRVYDAVRPDAPVIVSSIGHLTPMVPSKAPGYPCSVTFSEPVVGFTAEDLQVVNGIVSGFAGSGSAYAFTLTPAEGQVSVQIPAGACTDPAGYTVPASNLFRRVLDSRAPTVAQVASPAVGLAGFSNTQIPVRVIFSEPMSGFAQTDLRVEGATMSAFAAEAGGSAFTFTLWPQTTTPTRTVRLIVPAASANDTATSISAASSLVTFAYNAASAAFVVE